MLSARIVGLSAPSLFVCVISLVPLITQIKQRNIPTSVLIICILIKNLVYTTNALIWHSRNYAFWWDGRIFCDIQIRVAVALQVALLGAASCVFRQLSLVFNPSLVSPSRAEIRRTRLIELTFCVGIPVFRTTATYLVQPDRYWIYRIIGCVWTVDASWPSYILVHIWEPLVSIVGLVYAARTIIGMINHRRSTSFVLGQGQNPRNKSRIMRLYCLGLVLFLTFVPLQILTLYYDLPPSLEPYSWSRIHPPDWSERIFMFRPSNVYLRSIVLQYASTLYSVIVAILVGLTPDAIDTYKAWFAQFRVWTRRLSNKKAIPVSSGSSVAQRQHSIQSQSMDRHEMEALSVSRRDQEVV